MEGGGGRAVRKTEKETTRKIESKYELYKEIRGDTISKYLEDRRRAKDRGIIARFRTGNEINARLHWMKLNVHRMCKICGEKKEKMEHVLYEYMETIGVKTYLTKKEKN